MTTYFGKSESCIDRDGVRATESSYPAQLALGRHAHAHAHFCLVLRGEYEETLEGNREIRGPMSLIYYPADCPHAESHRLPGKHLLVEWDAEWARRLELNGILPGQPTVVRHTPALFAALRALRAIHDKPTTSVLDFESALMGVFDAFDVRPARPSRPAPGWLRHVMECLKNSDGDSHTFAGLADRVGVNPAHIARTFKRFVGCTMGEMRRRIQLEQACRHLASTGDALAHVAADTGFADQSHMTRALRQATGFTPRALRSVLRAN